LTVSSGPVRSQSERLRLADLRDARRFQLFGKEGSNGRATDFVAPSAHGPILSFLPRWTPLPASLRLWHRAWRNAPIRNISEWGGCSLDELLCVDVTELLE
jgi:hypothetical protein